MWEALSVNSGRDRAIETLIDMESNGAFYRAARILDEAVPNALTNRPNLITRPALIEQANALVEYEIDTVTKYDEEFPSPRTPPPKLKEYPDDHKDRILRHHDKMVMVQRVHGTTGSASHVAAAPPPSLVAALRRLYGSASISNNSKEKDIDKNVEHENKSRAVILRSLLRKVTNHSAFSTDSAAKDDQDNTDGTAGNLQEKSSVGSDEKDSNVFDTNDDISEEGIEGQIPAANLESVVGNVCRTAVADESLGKTSTGDENSLNGLLIAVLSILTEMTKEDEDNEQDGEIRQKEENKLSGSGSSVDSLKPIMPALQVGGVLSLLQSDSTDDEERNAFSLDRDILTYLGKAAATYEERIEIRKTHLIAKLQAEREKEAALKKEALEEETAVEDIENKETQASEDPPAPMTPTSAPMTPTGGDISGGEGGETEQSGSANVAIIDDDEVEEMKEDEVVAVDAPDDEAQSRSAEAALREGMFERIISQVSGEDSSSVEDADDAMARLIESGEVVDDEESSDSDSTNSDDENESDSTTGLDGAHGRDDPENPHSAPVDNGQYNQEDEEDAEIHDDDDDDSSSSSSSESGEDDPDPEANMLVEDNVVEMDGDDEDDAMLRQALALSLAEHSSSFATGNDNSGQDDSNREDGVEIEHGNNAEEEKLSSSSEGQSGSNPAEGENEISDSVDDEDITLPSLPVAPSCYPYIEWLSDISANHIDADRDATACSSNVEGSGKEEAPIPYLDPHALSKFGSIPSAHVMMHLLRYTMTKIAGRNELRGKKEEKKDVKALGEDYPKPSVPGGVGCSLFLPRQQSHEIDEKEEKESSSSHHDDTVSIQLLITVCALFSESRNRAIENLRQAILLEHQNAQEYVTEDEKEEEDGRTPTCDDEDDPAHALAMNFASSPSHSMSSSSISESLETKGMKRKAAAAAHDAAVVLKSIRKRAGAWRQRVQLFSNCTLIAMKCLRLYLQSIALRLLDPSSTYYTPGSIRPWLEGIPSTVRSKLSTMLNSFMSVSTSRTFSSLIAQDNGDEIEDLLLPLKLYREAVIVWGECVPLLYPSPAGRTELLRSMINDCYSNKSELSLALEPLEKLRSFPSSDFQSQVHRLRVLCRRLRVKDLLDDFISHPISYNPEDTSGSDETTVRRLLEEEDVLSQKPLIASPVLLLLGSTFSELEIDEGIELRKLYLALCHKCIGRALLWDGFYSCSNGDPDDRLTPSAASPASSSNELLRVSSNPSTNLQFDSTKCSDSITILANHTDSASPTNGSSVHQRASKVWGTVLSSSYFSPKTGVHRWAVRLDKCERGHVFVGVSTAQAGMRTYVGGDKYGWGVIGTQALWHDRRKIRGDYGASFRTGSTIIVTLDTDAGTLSFSSWKDGSTSATAFSLDALQPSPSRRSVPGGGGTAEDWGVAFEGLPLDSRLYPAVGLYQRDDRVTLLNVESAGRSSSAGDGVDGVVLSGGECYYPRLAKVLDIPGSMLQVRRYNDLLSWDGVQFVVDVLHRVNQIIQSEQCQNNVLVTSVLPSIAAALCLVPPSIPVLSARCALALLPEINQCIHALDKQISQTEDENDLFENGLKKGKWIIRATGSSGTLGSSECEEYIVNLGTITDSENTSIGFEGTGVGTTGKSKNGLVAITGTVRGSAIYFVEEWTDGNEEGSHPPVTEENSSSCVIVARLSLDGMKFEGTYRNVQYGTTGHIAGVLCSRESGGSRGPPIGKCGSSLVKCEALLCLAHGHLAATIGADTSGDHSQGVDIPSPTSCDASTWAEKSSVLKSIVSRPLLSCGLHDNLGEKRKQAIVSLKQLYTPPAATNIATETDGVITPQIDRVFLSIPQVNAAPSSHLHDASAEFVKKNDEKLTTLTGGKGSLNVLCPAEYCSSRQGILISLIYHLQLQDRLNLCSQDANRDTDDDLLSVWRTALRIMEDGVRKALSAPNTRNRTRREIGKDHCALVDKISSFLLKVEICSGSACFVTEECLSVYDKIESETDLQYIENVMNEATKRALLRTVALLETKSLISNDVGNGRIETPIAVECSALVLPLLLGRGLKETSVASGGSKEAEDSCRLYDDDLGGYYLTNLSGSGQILQSLRRVVHELFHALGRTLGQALAKRKKETSNESQVSIDSLVISILAAFTTSIRNCDIDGVVNGSNIFHHLPDLLSIHRGAIRTNHHTQPVVEANQVSIVSEIYEIVGRDISRSVLRAAVSVSHVFSFQLAKQTSMTSSFRVSGGNEDTDAVRSCTKLLLGELAQSIPLVEKIMKEETDSYGTQQADEQLKKWVEVCSPTKDGKSSSKQRKHKGNEKSAVAYFREHGTLPPSGTPAQAPRSSSKSSTSLSTGTASSARSEKLLSLLGAPCHHYMSHLLHILSAMVKFPSSLKVLSEDREWVKVLLQAVGLHCVFDGEQLTKVDVRQEHDNLLPARYRVRILRLMLSLFSASKPNEQLLEGIFILAGSTYAVIYKNVDDEENSVSREAVSLLRHLHSPSRNEWRACIENVIFSNVSTEREKGDSYKLGILAFFTGSIGRIRRGSYVLLKPAAAAPLSSDPQPSSSKSHGSSGSGSSSSGAGTTPHHVVGNGTEGIVAGLCRADASAGIVSSIDTKSGICEVILTNRQLTANQDSANLLQAPLRTRSSETGQTGFSSGRYTMTVRAVRAPLADIVNAEEVPLFLSSNLPVGELLGSSLPTALSSLSDSDVFSSFDTDDKCDDEAKDEEPDEEQAKPWRGENYREDSGKHIVKLCSSLMSLRSAITVLSDENLLTKFVLESSAREILHHVLQVASGDHTVASKFVDTVRLENLSSLPSHEAKYCQLLSMLQEVNNRIQVMESIPASHWKKVIPEFLPKNKENSSSKSGDSETSDSSKVAEGYSTPPATERSATVTPPAAGTTTGRDDGDASGSARNNPSDAQRTVSQTSEGTNSSEDEEDADSTAAAHLREAAIAQMAELGLPRSWSELALRRTGGTNIEAAVHFCLERGGDMERLLAEERERERMLQRQSTGGSSSTRRRSRDNSSSNHLLRQLLEMGFPSRWCAEALAATRNDVDAALTWILTNGERLSAEDEGMEEDEDDDGDDMDDDGDDDESGEEEEDENGEEGKPRGSEEASRADTSVDATGTAPNVEESTVESSKLKPQSEDKSEQGETTSVGWTGSVTPIRFVSGRSDINPKTLAISGLPTGGFSSVGTKGVLLTSGKWYYEAILETAGCLQIGWADGSFSGHCHADRGDGCGDGPSSWAYDGWRRYRWHATPTEWGCRWKEGDVVGCFVDMDEHIVSFTLNGRAEEIGMGVAFSGAGFRPCGGVYACVSFNRREKLRLILGGKESEAFKHPPPPGYRGVGDAVLDAVEERDNLIQKEDILDMRPQGSSQETGDLKSVSKRFLCDFSDGEHGHELFAWQHRYYGSDASVHLGSGRSKQLSGSQKNSGSGGTYMDSSASACVSRRMEKMWTKQKGSSDNQMTSFSDSTDPASIISKLKDDYKEAAFQITFDIIKECIALGTLYTRKLILHLMVTKGNGFDLQYFHRSGDNSKNSLSVMDDEEVVTARRLWCVLDICVSLRSAGWVGEAGAMAIAAEALGLGISSNDNHHHLRYLSSERSGAASAGFDSTVFLSGGGISQLLSTTLTSAIVRDAKECDTSHSLAAASEASIGGEGGGGPLVFLQRGLQSAVCRSKSFRDILIAVVRRSVRLLAVVEYSGNDALQKENLDLQDEDTDLSAGAFERSARAKDNQVDEDDQDGTLQPDARLACFLTGLLLSKPVQSALEDPSAVKTELFEAWSIGLLSASAPWRMVCALTASGILNQCPEALSESVKSVPTLARLYSRLESTVLRRVWAERAAVPVCSRYVQSMIELLASVKRAIRVSVPSSPFVKSWGASVDAATPIPLKAPCVENMTTEPPPEGQAWKPSCWEWEDGWVTNDSGWEVWSGTFEFRPVDWKTPGRSAVRTLMDGGEGPPMLREGCHVMRGLDWEDERSGSKTGNEDGKELYEAEKAEREKEKQNVEEKESQQDPATIKEEPIKSDTPVPTQDEQNECSDPVVESVPEQATSSDPVEPTSSDDKNEDDKNEAGGNKKPQDSTVKKKKRRKIPSPKLPIGTVLSIEPWNGIPAMARKVRWQLTGTEGVYRYGGDGGRYDISHVEVNDKATRVRKRHPLPESAEQCVSRHGFGVSKRYSALLRIRRHGSQVLAAGEIEMNHQGVLELPDFGAGIRVDCTLHQDGAVTITEQELLYGSKDSGWEARFGQPSYKPGSVIVLSPTRSSTTTEQANLDAKSAFSSFYEELLGSSSFTTKTLRNRGDGTAVRVVSEMKLLRSKRTPDSNKHCLLPPIQAPLPPPICFDRDFKASSISLSRDGRTVTCIAPDGRGTAFASVGFTKGVHYWEVKLEQADIGSVFIGVAEKPNGSMGSGGSAFGPDSQPRLNRWHGWGFVNFRATYTSGAERVYGAHCHAGDTVGVLLDCDAGRVSFFFDGLKYGEHILNDLGCAFENVSPFGFNADGCGSGGAGQGAPSGIEGGRGGRYPAQGSVKLRALWPVIGLRNPGDRVTISSKWMSGSGVDGMISLKNVLAVDEILYRYDQTIKSNSKSLAATKDSDIRFPEWFIQEAFAEYQLWYQGELYRTRTRGSGAYRLATVGLDIDVDTTPLASASACAALGLPHALLPGDKVVVKRSAGRMLELAEEAVVLGACQGRLFYRLVSQKSEGGSLTEGGGRAWFWDESEVVDNGLQLIGSGRGLGIQLPLLDRFRCTAPGGLKIVYDGGAVVRSDLEIFDGSANIGTVPVDTVLPQKDVLERRVNSCGVVRYRIRYEPVGEGWISSRIRGGQEESIVLPVHSNDNDESEHHDSLSFPLPHDAAMAWYKEYQDELKKQQESKKDVTAFNMSELTIMDVNEFEQEMKEALIPGLSVAASDSLIASAISAIADFSEGGDAVDCSFKDIAAALSFAVASFSKEGGKASPTEIDVPGANQAAASLFAKQNVPLPSLKALLARAAVLRALNRRARLALPWLSVRPSQEGSAIFGGLCGHGASIERAGRNIHSKSMELWVQPPSIASRMRSFRSLIFCSVKRMLLDSITDATTTPTPLSHDEYELPREIRTVRVNRLKAHRAMAGNDNLAKRKHSVFSQLHNETRGWGGAALRRGFVAKGHGGQKRAFKVKLVGEGVNDYSGPYREAFTDAIREVMELDANGHGALSVLEPTPNNASGIGDNRELFMFSTGDRNLSGETNDSSLNLTSEEFRIKDSFLTLTTARDENSREVEESLIFLGRMTGTACRHGIPVDLPLPLHSVWKPLVEEKSDDGERLKEIDLLAHRQQLEESKDYSEKPKLVWWQQRMLNSIVEGMSNVLPMEIFPVFTGEELRDILCGNPEVDVDLLRRVVEYEGYEESDDVIVHFWEALREMSNEERKKFLQFVWARSRLPIKESDFDAPFKIQKDSTAFGIDDAGIPLPSASTCFFSLTLPPYDSKDMLKQKLLFAIDNVCTMESDYVTNDAEVGEGWRGL